MKYLIAVDASDNSRFAFRRAKKNFFTKEDHVFILAVAESPSTYPFEDVFNFGSSETYSEMNQKIELIYSNLLKRYGRKLTKEEVPHTCLMAKGTIRDVICRQAEDLNVDMVIMGRRGLGRFERAFIGSTSQYCAHNLKCAVLVIPSTAGKLSPSSSDEELKNKEEYPEQVGFESKIESPKRERERVDAKVCDHPDCASDRCSREEYKGSRQGFLGKMEGKVCEHPECGSDRCSKIQSEKGGKWQEYMEMGKGELPVTKEDLKYEGGAGRLERAGGSHLQSDISKDVARQKGECNDSQCRDNECPVHGLKADRKLAEGECKDPHCQRDDCPVHGRKERIYQHRKECKDPDCNQKELHEDLPSPPLKEAKFQVERESQKVSDVKVKSASDSPGDDSKPTFAAIVEKSLKVEGKGSPTTEQFRLKEKERVESQFVSQ